MRLKKISQGIAANMPAHVKFPMVMAILCVCLGIAYVVNVNAQSTTGFQLREGEQLRSSVAREVQDLEQEVSLLTSIGMIETAARSMDLVSAGDAEYAVPETGVAVGNPSANP